MPEFWITLLEQLKESKVALLILAGAGMFLVIGGLAALSHCYTLSGIKSRTVGDGVNHQFIEYALPLIQGEPELPKQDSLPRFAKLKKILAK